MEQSFNIISLKEFLTVIFKHQKKILAVFGTVVILVTLVNLLLPPTYVADSSIMVKFGREYVYNPEVGDTNSVNSILSMGQAEIVNSEIEIIKSRDLFEKTIISLGLENIYPELVESPPTGLSPLDAAILEFEKNLSVESVRKSNVIKISFGHEDPEISAQAVNKLVDLLREKHLQVFKKPESSLLENQLNIYQKKLTDSETEFEDYKQKFQVYSHDEQRSLLLQQRTNMDTSLKANTNDIIEMEQKIVSLKLQKRSISKNVPLYTETGAVRFNIVDETKARLLALKLREQELLGKYEIGNHFPESVRMVANVRNEIILVTKYLKEQEEKLKDKVTTGRNVIYQNIEIEFIKARATLSSMKSKSSNIKRQIIQLDKEIKSLDLRERELKKLKRTLDTNERNYETYLKKSEEARILQNMDHLKLANFSVIQEATIPAKPLKPKKAFNIFMSMVFGILFGLAVAFILEYTGQSLSSPENAENRLGLPVIASFSYKSEVADEPEWAIKKPSLIAGVGSAIVLVLISGYFWPSQNNFHEIVRAKKFDLTQVPQSAIVGLNIPFKLPVLDGDLIREKRKILPSPESANKKMGIDDVSNFPSGGASATQQKDEVSITALSVKGSGKGDLSGRLNEKKLFDDNPATRWAINVFSLPTIDEATGIQVKLKNAGYSAYITEFKQQKKIWYRVRVGFYSTQKEANQIGKNLSQKHYIKNYWIVKPTEDEKLTHS
jgi:uncharacterized protein involved in exopolysaccharide biosynthesis